VVRPNFDTLYSSAWVDVSRGPVYIDVPPLYHDRFFMLPFYDMWTDVFAAPGTARPGPRRTELRWWRTATTAPCARATT
jgi:hypothetical protein